MNNQTNLTKYKRLAPYYDKLMGNSLFASGRRKAFSQVQIRPQEQVLLVGVGTGEDLRFLPHDVNITGIDLSEAMLKQARNKAESEVSLLIMNAENLQFVDETFDVVVLNLILSVVENPDRAMDEALRVLKKDGTILIFDKFLEENQKPSWLRLLFNRLTTALGTDINRKLSQILSDRDVQIIEDRPVMLGGAYRAITLRAANVLSSAKR